MELRVVDLETYYGDSYVLQGVSLEVPHGGIVALLGRNGVGKTTLIRSIMGLTPPRAGQVLLDGRDITGERPEVIARLGVGLVPQGRQIFPSLTVKENLLIGARRGGRGEWTLEQIYELFPNLAARQANRGSQLSGGEQQMLAIARALMTSPQVLLMDEPSEGLAPLLVRRVGEVIRTLRERGITILLVEQNLGLALEVADRVHIMVKGQIVYQAAPEDLARDREAQRAYLGIG